MEYREPDFSSILQVMVNHKVDFIVIGGICAVLHGAPVMTFDLDLVHSRSDANIKRLMSALKELDAYYREHAPKHIIPEEASLKKPGHHLLMTRKGPLDLLGTVTNERGYEELREHTVRVSIEDDFEIIILDLATLILIKEEAGFEKDMAVLPILRRTLEEMDRE